MAKFGVTDEGFVVKGLDVILSESQARAREMFGTDVDLTSTSVLRKLLEVDAAEKAEIWKRSEDLYYSNWASTAFGDNLDLLGEDLGVSRRFVFARGIAVLTISSPAPARQYVIPEGTVLVTGGPVQSFHTTATVTLSAASPSVPVPVQAFQRGPAGNVAANAITGVDPVFARLYLNLGPAVTVTADNPAPLEGGEGLETDEVYRSRLLGVPRTLWTLESVRRAVLDIDGVIDAMLFDPLGGVDVSQSRFNVFRFSERLFSADRRIGEPYFFDIVVAHEFARPWRTQGSVTGIFERVIAATDRVRPTGIHPNIVEANHIEVGFQAEVIIQPGSDAKSIAAAIRERVANDIGSLKLGGDVLYSQIVRACVEHPAVLDVQNLRLRRCPAAFGRITFGAVPLLAAVIETAPGENLVLGATEIATFRLDSTLIELEVVER
jgi:uncharacterized phage protein gp47/JayE